MGQALASDGFEAGQVRMQARTLYKEHGEGLVSSFTGQWERFGSGGTADAVARQ